MGPLENAISQVEKQDAKRIEGQGQLILGIGMLLTPQDDESRRKPYVGKLAGAGVARPLVLRITVAAAFLALNCENQPPRLWHWTMGISGP